MKKYKQFIIGFIVGAMLFSIAPVSAAIEEYICYKADYKLIINGTEFVNPEQPLLNYNGITYVPTSVLEKAGLNVIQNNELKKMEVTSSPTSTQNNNVEVTTMSTTITYNLETKLPVGAVKTEYKGFNDAVSYNGNTYVPRSSLSSIFGIKEKQFDVKNRTIVFGNDTSNVTIDLNAPGNHFLTSLGYPYYNVNLFEPLIGE